MLYYTDTPENRDIIVNKLKECVLVLLITKSDGVNRNVYCTLKPDLLPPSVPSPDQKKKVWDDIQPIWDTEVQAWRSFNWLRLHTYAEVVSDEELGLK